LPAQIGRETDLGIVLAATIAASFSRLKAGRSRRQADGSHLIRRQPGHMTSTIGQMSPLLSASAAGLAAAGIACGLVSYLHRSPVRQAHVPGTSAWVQHLIVAAVAGALYGVARWRHGHRPGRGSGRLLLLAPLGRSAASRLAATTRPLSWRPVAALPPLAMIAYGFWRNGEQVTGGLDPNFTVSAWGGPTYLGAMACHYLDGGLIIAACGWLLDWILLPAAAGRSR
jgi:hypothetical protein